MCNTGRLAGQSANDIVHKMLKSLWCMHAQGICRIRYKRNKIKVECTRNGLFHTCRVSEGNPNTGYLKNIHHILIEKK